MSQNLVDEISPKFIRSRSTDPEEDPTTALGLKQAESTLSDFFQQYHPLAERKDDSNEFVSVPTIERTKSGFGLSTMAVPRHEREKKLGPRKRSSFELTELDILRLRPFIHAINVK